MSSPKKSKSKARHAVSYQQHHALLKKLQAMERTNKELLTGSDELLQRLEKVAGEGFPHTPVQLREELDALLRDYPAEKLAYHVLDAIEGTVAGGAHDGLAAQDCDGLYPMFRLFRALNRPGPLPQRELKVEKREAA